MKRKEQVEIEVWEKERIERYSVLRRECSHQRNSLAKPQIGVVNTTKKTKTTRPWVARRTRSFGKIWEAMGGPLTGAWARPIDHRLGPIGALERSGWRGPTKEAKSG